MADIVFSVSQINEYLRKKFFDDPFLSEVTIVGEVTNFSMSSVGHAFFSLKDDTNMLGCIVYDFEDSDVKDVIVDGTMIKAKGRITLYKKTASLQLAVASASSVGIGDLFERFEQTKRKLAAEGLFDTAHKKPLPAFPLRIGVVTSAAGAALHDIISVSTRRFGGIHIKVYSAQVQGYDAARQICSGIRRFNDMNDVDVIIVGRGGGSFEDLFAFNEECVARAVYDSDIPVVSAVGHETDFSLCDMAADLRAPTPSAAAEMVIPKKQDIVAYIENRQDAMRSALRETNRQYELRLDRLRDMMRSYPLQLKVTQTQQAVSSCRELMRRSITTLLERYKLILDRYENSLENLNPKGVLERGYTLVYDDAGHIITSVMAAGDAMSIEFHDGHIAVQRKEVGNG
jgi:exodeoxyribonuclease VII large subunit